jgi:predicted transcriptional regulator
MDEKQAITIRPDDLIRLPMELMHKNRIHRLPVVEDRTVVGIITAPYTGTMTEIVYCPTEPSLEYRLASRIL